MKVARWLDSVNASMLSGFALATLVPRLPSLWQVASRRGKIAVATQLALLVFLLKLKRGKQVLQLLEYLPKTLIPASALAALCGDAWARISHAGVEAEAKASRLVWFVVTLGMVPNLAESVKEGWNSLTSGEADVPALIAMQLGLCLNQTRAAAVILLMLTGGEAFEDYALNCAGDALHSLLHLSPGIAHVARKGIADGSAGVEDVPTESVCAGDIMLVKHGEVAPVDGEIVSSSVSDASARPKETAEKVGEKPIFVLDESLLTGEGLLAEKTYEDRVLAGSRNKGHAFWMRASGMYSNSVMALMQAKLGEALEKKAKLELDSKRFVAMFTPFTFAAAALSSIVSDLRAVSPRSKWEAILSVFMSATPCPAGIGVPIAMLSGMSVASKSYGGTVKAGTALELLAKANVVVLDKTGTLTRGEPSVTDFCIFLNEAQLPLDVVLQHLASVEQYSSHPLGEAVCVYYHTHGNGEGSLLPIEDVQHMDGAGIAGTVGGYQVMIGSHAFCFDGLQEAEKESFAMSHQQSQRQGDHTCNSKTTGRADVLEAYFLLKDAETGAPAVSGRLSFEDKIRKSAWTLVSKLRDDLGMRVIMLSGDRTGHLAKVAKDLGIDEYEACWPHEKAERVKTLREQGNVVLMVGDGGNDSAALAAADVGMSIGALNLASESASVVLMNEDLNNVAKLVELSRNVVTIARKTVFYGMSASMVQMAVAALGLSTPFLSALAQEGVDLAAVLHSLRALSL